MHRRINVCWSQKMKYKVNHFSYIRLFRLENIWTIIVLLLFIKPQIADDIGILDLFFNVGRVGVSFIYLFMLIVNKKRLIRRGYAW